MEFNKRQIDVIKKGFENYDFIKDILENKINLKNYKAKELCGVLLEFKDMEITNYEELTDITYLDFIYKNVNMCVIEEKNRIAKVSPRFEIYDDVNQEYLVEDFLTKEEYMREIRHNIKSFDFTLIRFTTFEDLKNKLNKKLADYGLQVNNYGFKSDYCDEEDFCIAITLGTKEELELYDLDLWFAITRIGERIIVESGINEV